ncbi:MAG: NAD(P)H-hydrate dehydratase [Burkholderiaceae bacterium]
MPRRLPDPAADRTPDLALFDAATTRRIEARAAAALPPHELMARAGRALARLARACAPHARRAWIACGPGNNGGDGLVLATHLHAAGVAVVASLVGHRADRPLPDDAAWALAQARAAGVAIVDGLPDAAALAAMDLRVDALLGVGQSRAPEGPLAAAIAALNAAGGTLLAVDLPTGLSGDTGATLGDAVVRADHTLVLLTAKPGLFTGDGREHGGALWFDDLGVEPGAGEAPVATVAGASTAARRHARRGQVANKGSFGDVHVAGGAAGMVGATLLAGHAASLAGAGRVLVHGHASDPGGPLPVDVRHPELMLRPAAELEPSLRGNARATVVAGCGGGDEAAAQLPGLLAHAARLVLDADALNAIARDEALRAQLRHRGERGAPTILTPHPLEAARLLGASAAEVQADRLAAARRLAADCRAVVVLKGSGTVVAAPDGRLSINPTGDARLATAGTGDVLAGWIGGLWSAQPRADAGDAVAARQQAEGANELAREVAVAAAFVHGRACAFAPGDRRPIVAGELAALMARTVDALDA